MMRPRAPLVLNFDDSVAARDFPDAVSIPLQGWQELVRFGCRHGRLRQLADALAPLWPSDYGCVFTGSGDFHHLSYLLLGRMATKPAFELVICDNHPDNMRYPFGIHCGSWVYWASRLPQVKHIHVLGICSADIGLGHAWENHWAPLVGKKLTYWHLNRANTRWLDWLGPAGRGYGDADALLTDFLAVFTGGDRSPAYLSIDKDVLSPRVVTTNWDQGIFEERHLNQVIDACHGRLIGADITGEGSVYRYQSRFKRWLSAIDGQQEATSDQAAAWQQRQNALNRRLAARIATVWR
ncbi:hypothetical protein [Martelella alba]|uniref:Arginase family protein n=1 Tax=Martelella alba TaxID=2590451 RepID=A0ABY2SGZ6_9HYPH|nr:hypothetical protein [Martelella alba]TKI04477.1 hypothetical protein FCN80_17795 [Martelella alba]